MTSHAGHSAAAAGDLTPGVDLDAVVARARAAGLAGPLEITPPADEHSGWTVAQTDNRWPVRRDQAAGRPGLRRGRGGQPLGRPPLLAKLSTLGIQAHMGMLFGLPNQLLLAALALGLLCVLTWGYRSWWQRRPTRSDHRRCSASPSPPFWPSTPSCRSAAAPWFPEWVEMLVVLSRGAGPPQGAVRQRLGDRVLIVDADTAELWPGVAAVLDFPEPGRVRTRGELPADLSDEEELFVSAWVRRHSTSKQRAAEGLAWDTPGYEPPDPPG